MCSNATAACLHSKLVCWCSGLSVTINKPTVEWEKCNPDLFKELTHKKIWTSEPKQERPVCIIYWETFTSLHVSSMTFPWLFHNSSLTLPWLFLDSSKIREKFMTNSWQIHDTFMTLSWHIHDIVMTHPWHIHDTSMTHHDTIMTHSLSLHIQDTFRTHQDTS